MNELFTAYHPDDEFVKMFKSKSDKQHYSALFELLTYSIFRLSDFSLLRHSVGKVLIALQQKGIIENAIIVFTNDNGGPFAEHGANGSNNEPLRGAKVMLYEGGIRVPMILHWPVRLKSAGKSNQLVSTIDLLPTFLAVAGYKTPLTDLDGRNIFLLLENNRNVAYRNLFWRQGKTGVVRSGDWKFYFDVGRQPELYNLKNDIGETTNLFSKQKKIARNLITLYNQWQKMLANPL